LRAFGTGIADGKGSQIAFEAISIPDETADLFDIQAWLSAGDIAFPQLLAARANAELALRLGAWENIEGEPIARDRLADTFPLTGVISQFRWQPGDGVRLKLPDVAIDDTANRQILQVERSFSPEGRTLTRIGFRARPKDPLYVLRTALRDATRPARAYQKQYTTRLGTQGEATHLAAGGFTTYSQASLTPQDKVIGAVAHIGVNTGAESLGIEINGELRTSALGGPWMAPTALDITPYAVPHSATADQRLYVRLKNEGAEKAGFIWVTLVLTILV
jgi:hypothetical protein